VKAKKPPGLYANIAAKRKRIEAGSDERMARKGEAGRPSAAHLRLLLKLRRSQSEEEVITYRGEQFSGYNKPKADA
jgi:hypothetical protein